MRTRHGIAERGNRRLGIEADDKHRSGALRRRHDFNRHFMQRREGAPGAGEQFAEIIAGDVLDHLAAGFERLRPPADGMKAEQMIARGAGLDAARTGQIASQRPAERRPRLGTKERAIIGRLESQHLLFLVKRRLDFCERRGGTGGQH